MRRRRPKRAWDIADRLLNWFLDKPGWLPFAVSPLSVAAVTVTLWSIHNTLVVALVVGLVVGYVVLAAGTAALVQRYERRQLLAFEYRLARLRRLSWEELEVVVAEVFRADGYAVVETGQAGPDGGVDLVLNRGSQKTFVQCKQMPGWLDVRPLREFFGVMCLEKATAGIVVTTGGFSAAARDWAKRAGIQLVNGTQLEQKVRDLVVAQRGAPTPTNLTLPLLDGTLVCPLCRSDMRWAGGTRNSWQCIRAPGCTGVVRLRRSA